MLTYADVCWRADVCCGRHALYMLTRAHLLTPIADMLTCAHVILISRY